MTWRLKMGMAALTCWAWMTCETSCQLGAPRTLGVPRALTLCSCQPATHEGLARRWLPPVCAMLCAWRWRVRCSTALPWSLHGTQAPAFHGHLPPQAHESLLAVWCDLYRQFYTALAVGDTVQAAFEIGKQSVKTAPHVPNSHLESDKFLLLPKVCCAPAVALLVCSTVHRLCVCPTTQGGDHNVAVFQRRPSVSVWPTARMRNAGRRLPGGGGAGGGAGAGGSAGSSGSMSREVFDDGSASFEALTGTLPARAEYFAGRNKEMYHVVSGC